MCIVSLVVDSAPKQWGLVQTWPMPVVQDMSRVIEILERIDKKLGAPDCAEDKKTKFMKELQERVVQLETEFKEHCREYGAGNSEAV